LLAGHSTPINYHGHKLTRIIGESAAINTLCVVFDLTF